MQGYGVKFSRRGQPDAPARTSARIAAVYQIVEGQFQHVWPKVIATPQPAGARCRRPPRLPRADRSAEAAGSRRRPPTPGTGRRPVPGASPPGMTPRAHRSTGSPSSSAASPRSTRVSFEVARGRDPRAHRAQRLRQDDAVQLHLRRAAADGRAPSASRTQEIAGLTPDAHLPPGHRADLPDPAPVPQARRSSRTWRWPRTSARHQRNTRGGGARARAAEILTLVGLPADAGRVHDPARRGRPQEARAGARARHRARRCSSPTRAWAGSIPPRWRAPPRCCAASAASSAITIVWVEHIMAHPDARGRPRGRARPRREDRRGAAARGRRGSAGRRGVPRREGGAGVSMLELAPGHRGLRRLHRALGREPRA